MSEYIEKQAAATIPVLPKEHRKYQTANLDDAYENGWYDALECVEKIPSADVRPVVHGRWVKVGGFFTPGGDPVWQCSECGKGRHVYGIEHGSYNADVSDGQWLACPNCMAIMEGEEQ